jgi:hypothetical protein
VWIAISAVEPRVLVRVRIKKTPPAPVMDGFDVRSFHAGHVYNVPAPLGRYLLVAGYAEPHVPDIDRVDDRPRRRVKGRHDDP